MHQKLQNIPPKLAMIKFQMIEQNTKICKNKVLYILFQSHKNLDKFNIDNKYSN